MVKILLSVVLALSLVGTVDAKSSAASSARSSPGISLSKATPVAKTGGISLTKPAVVAPTAKTGGINLAKPAPATPAVTPSPTPSRGWFGRSNNQTANNTNRTVTIVHEHHYFGGGYGYGRGYYGGYSGGFGSSPFFWLWLLDRPQPQTVIVNGQPTQNGATGSYSEPSGVTKFFNVLLGLLLIGGIIALIVWIARKFFIK